MANLVMINKKLLTAFIKFQNDFNKLNSAYLLERNNIGLILQKTFEPISSTILFGEKHASKILKITEPLMKIESQYRRLLQNLQPFIDILNSEIETLVNSQFIIDIIEKFKDYHEFKDAFSYGNWPIGPSMPISLCKEVAYNYQKRNKSGISNVISGYYRKNNYENLNNMVDSWKNNPFIKKRFHIIKSAQKNHTQRDYYSSIPPLVNQIEGILADYIEQNNLGVRIGKSTKIAETVLDENNASSLFVLIIYSVLLLVIKNNLYQKSNFEKEIKKSVNQVSVSRHTINHGLSVNYGTHVMSLKCFLIIDALSLISSNDYEN